LNSEINTCVNKPSLIPTLEFTIDRLIEQVFLTLRMEDEERKQKNVIL